MNYILTKDWTPENHAEVQRALVEYRMQMRASGHPYSPIFDKHFDFAANSVASGAVEAMIVGSYLVIFTVASLWIAPVPVFIELMLMRLSERPAGNFDDVRECMEALSAERGCAAVVVGNAYLRPGLTRHYEKSGYRHSNMEIIKEIPNG